MRHNQRFIWLDLVRGLSALAVCAGHLRGVVFEDFTHHAAARAWQPFYFVTGLGHQAVMVFFVLSGFFVGGSVLKQGKAFAWADYATARLTRLWTVLLPALAVTVVVDVVTNAVSPDIAAGRFTGWNSLPGPGPLARDAGTWVANALFLQTVTSPVFGTNGPLWSLANEFWYYVLFPLCAAAIGLCGQARGAGRGAAFVLAVAVLAWLPAGIRVNYLVWLFGIGVWFVAARRLLGTRASAVAWAGLLLFALSLVASKRPSVAGFAGAADFVVGAGFAVLAAGLVSLNGPRAWPRPLAACARATSEISYSLYVVHFPIVVLIGATCYHVRLAPGPLALAEYLGWLAGLVAISAGFWWAFERRTQEVRRFVSAATGRAVPGPQAAMRSAR
jgi:peptidoglycan/LPS O-acetylase OafA/YrhL